MLSEAKHLGSAIELRRNTRSFASLRMTPSQLGVSLAFSDRLLGRPKPGGRRRVSETLKNPIDVLDFEELEP